MNIQSSLGLQAFQGAGRIAPTTPSTTSSASAGTPTGAAAQGTSDKVSISMAGKALAASEGSEAPARTPSQERFLQTLSDNTPAQSEKLAYELAYSRRITYDISHGDIRLSSTGEVVGEGYAEKFSALAAVVDANKRALYEAEKAKGTDPREIIAKMLDFHNAQSTEYRVATGAWLT